MKELNFGLGCNPSKIDGSELIFVNNSLTLPEEYSFQSQMPPVLNQGSTNMCVTYSLGAHIDWNINMDYGTECKDNNVNRKQIYSARSISGDNGMTFKEAFNFVKKVGVDTNDGRRKIEYYARLGNIEDLKAAIISNGPCMGGMMCYDDSVEFWKPGYSSKSLGGHAISIIGWNKDGFIIRNSWGKNWGFNGHAVLKYKDFDYLFEAWTVLD